MTGIEISGGRFAAPLSFAQQGLWVVDQLAADGSAYHVPIGLRLRGKLDPGRLQAAFQQVIARHDVLRTTFEPDRDGRPVQRVHARDPAPLPIDDLTGRPAEDRERLARKKIMEWSEEPFDLRKGPLIKARVIKLSETEHILTLVLHHAVFDGWSMDVLSRDLSVGYARPAEPAPPLRMQYADYARRQRESITGAVLAADRAWWRDHLRGFPTELTLPLDRPRPAGFSAPAALVTRRLSPATLAGVAALARRASTTPFTVLLAAWAVVLGRFTGMPRLLIGVPVAGRPRVELHDLIGLFVNTVPVRAEISPQRSFMDHVETVRGSLLQSLAHDRTPFEEIVNAVRPRRPAGTPPLLQTTFAAPLEAPRPPVLAGLETQLTTVPPSRAKFDLDLSVMAAGDTPGHRIALAYHAGILDEASAARIVEAYALLLREVLTAPDVPLGGLEILDERDRRTILGTWSGAGRTDGDDDAPIHELVVRRAAVTPDAPAVRADGATLTYRELESRSSRLARVLLDRGVGPGGLAGVCAPRGAGYLTACLAVLRAGAAYVPLDPVQPRLRLADVVRRAGAGVVLATSAADEERLRDAAVTVIRTDLLDLSPAAPGAPPVRVAPESLAYAIFTSGSTGVPKGVAVPHAALARHGRALRERTGLTEADRVLQFHPVNFDVTLEETYPTWLAGGCVVVLPEPTPAPAMVEAFLRAEAVTVANLPTGYWRQWTVEAAPPALRLMVIGGEQADRASADRWLTRTGIPLINAYGLTETAITSTAHDVVPDEGGPVPIGRPIAGAEAYVLDASLRPTPPGVPGDLYLGGAGLAHGYLGQPGLTAQRFVPHPFSGRPGARLHVTGDRAYWRADGVLVFLGRSDDQVKIAGYRVEPGEIEAVLDAHPGVRQSFVATAGPDHQRLAAYVAPAGETLPADLRAWVAARLPHFAVPATFVALTHLPLTANGKVDRAALPDPGAAGAAGPVGGAAPATATERLVAAIWRDVLGGAAIGATDNFFDAGGSSLTLAAVHSRLTRELGRPVPMVTLYEHATVATLAAHLDGTAGDTTPETVPTPTRYRLPQQRIRRRARSPRNGDGPSWSSTT